MSCARRSIRLWSRGYSSGGEHSLPSQRSRRRSRRPEAAAEAAAAAGGADGASSVHGRGAAASNFSAIFSAAFFSALSAAAIFACSVLCSSAALPSPPPESRPRPVRRRVRRQEEGAGTFAPLVAPSDPEAAALERLKTEWMGEAEPEAPEEPDRGDGKRTAQEAIEAATRKLGMHHVRFDLQGHVVDAERAEQIDVREGLHHHGEAPAARRGTPSPS